MNRVAVVEASKELFRVLLFAAVSWGISYLTSLPHTQTTLVGLAVLRWVDSYIHNNPNVKLNGISPV